MGVLSTNDQYINRVFDVFDDNKDGHIDAAELALILFPEKYNEENKDESIEDYDDEADEDAQKFLASVQKMINEVDLDGDGRIDFEEFKKAMNEDFEAGLIGTNRDDDGCKTLEE